MRVFLIWTTHRQRIRGWRKQRRRSTAISLVSGPLEVRFPGEGVRWRGVPQFRALLSLSHPTFPSFFTLSKASRAIFVVCEALEPSTIHVWSSLGHLGAGERKSSEMLGCPALCVSQYRRVQHRGGGGVQHHRRQRSPFGRKSPSFLLETSSTPPPPSSLKVRQPPLPLPLPPSLTVQKCYIRLFAREQTKHEPSHVTRFGRCQVLTPPQTVFHPTVTPISGDNGPPATKVD